MSEFVRQVAQPILSENSWEVVDESSESNVVDVQTKENQDEAEDVEKPVEIELFQTQSNQVVPHVVSFSIVDLIKKAAINLVLPFINGIMLGFGEIFAHEIGFRYNFRGARVQPPIRVQRKQQSQFL